MTKQKDEIIWRSWAFTWFIVFIVVFIGFMIVGAVYGKENKDLRQELQSCQDDFLVWTLEVKCDYGFEKWNTTYSFKSESFYNSFLEDFKWDYDQENCEVIE